MHAIHVSSPTIIYEVNLDSDPAISDEFEAWLREHIRSMLKLKGFLSATLYSIESDQDSPRHRYSVHFLLESHAALEQSLGEHAAATYRMGVERFGERFTLDHRVLTESEAGDGLAASMYCKNCASPIRGQYCASCGQRSQVRVITLWELTRDMVGDIADLDSRIWRSLIPLLLKPGQLTVDYLRGRRARYMPPFRMYLVLSLLFFLLFSLLNDTSEFRVTTDGGAETTREQAEMAQEVLTEVMPESANDPEVAKELEAAREALARKAAGNPDEPAEAKRSVEQRCAEAEINIHFDLPWVTGEEMETQVRAACVKVLSDNGKSLVRALLDNVPKTLFAFLPLIALVLKILYPLSRRYYVEHLLFVIHFHAFVFLALMLDMLFAALFGRLGWATWPLTMAISLYAPFYLYRSMRVVYRQGRWTTLFKYFLLLFSYLISLVLTFLATLAFTALTL